jgi:flagellar motor switch protein FliN/FliY
MVTKISFDMEIEGLLKSELIQLIPYEESRRFAKQFIDAGSVAIPQDSKTETSPKATAAPAPEAAAPPPTAQTTPPPEAATPPPQPSAADPQAPPPVQQVPYPGQDPYRQMPYPPDPYQQMPYPGVPYPPQQAPLPQPPYQQPAASAGRLVDVHPMQFQAFDSPTLPTEQKGIDLVYNIPLQVTVELGKTKKEINEILKFSAGTVVVLDKIAGDPVEIVVNGKLIAKGEVVVIDENYGVRITDIINL